MTTADATMTKPLPHHQSGPRTIDGRLYYRTLQLVSLLLRKRHTSTIGGLAKCPFITFVHSWVASWALRIAMRAQPSLRAPDIENTSSDDHSPSPPPA